MTTGRPKSKPVPLSPPVRTFPLVAGPLVIASVLVLLASACTWSDPVFETSPDGSFHPDGFDGVSGRLPDDLFDPVESGEPIPEGAWRRVLDHDEILPVYQPRFVLPENAGWQPDELIIGVDLEGEARAYPVAFLNRREIVVDLHRGIPTFVTW